MEPLVQYCTTSDGVNIAYYVAGQGQPLLRVPSPPYSHAQRSWEAFPLAVQALAESFRLVGYDPRRSGLSDHSVADLSLDAMVRDIEAVVDAAGLDTFALCAFADGVPIGICYAVKQPERLSHLVLVDGWANASDYATSSTWQVEQAIRDKDWVLYTETVSRVLVGHADEDARAFAEFMRAAMGPDDLRAVYAAFEHWDASGLLARVVTPTLVIHSREHPFQPVQAGQRLAAHIPGARFIEVDDALYGQRSARVPALIKEFLGVREPAPASMAHTAGAGALRTILFTDIADSTALTQRLGDAQAQELVRAHNGIVREALGAHGGSEVKHTGDGIMASFPTASGALECAVAIQRGVADRDAGAHGHAPLQLHIGSNAGEPVAEEHDLFGTAVQLARRICDQAQGGEILASDVIRQLAAGKGILFADRGEVALRGFEDPARLYEVRWRK